MDANWFNALFDEHYENVMNNVGRYVSDGFAGTSSASGFGDSFGDRYVNYNNVAPQSQTSGHQRPSRMDYIRDGIANSLMGQ
ncbi:hypothetical protein POTOM_041376 [Populus tomentosa]|uniref:Uncharacterized protein n=1 Tax=Populus tomentosa TaxID=118781 RepID=A0A8X7Z2E3_POPTO|nr:hypothetical protein POTOM_041376 [Populus tomentosa]